MCLRCPAAHLNLLYLSNRGQHVLQSYFSGFNWKGEKERRARRSQLQLHQTPVTQRERLKCFCLHFLNLPLIRVLCKIWMLLSTLVQAHTHTHVGRWRSFCILRLYSKSNLSSTHSFLCAHIHTEGEFTLTQILVSSRPLSKFGKQMWKQERGETLGEGEQYERWTNRLAARKGIVLLAPFSHYTTLSPSVCVCVYFKSNHADIILQTFTDFPRSCHLRSRFGSGKKGRIGRVMLGCKRRRDCHILVAERVTVCMLEI